MYINIIIDIYRKRGLIMNIDNVIDTAIQDFLFKEFRSCLGTPNKLLEFDKSERETILIVEQISVAAVAYKQVIRSILEVIEECLDNYDYNDKAYDLNTIDGIDVYWSKRYFVSIYFLNDYASQAMYMPSYTKIRQEGDESTVEEMHVQLLVNPRDYKWYNMEKFLYHEMNHSRDDAGRIANGSLTLQDLQDDKTNVYYEKTFRNIENDVTAYVIHYLFVDTEFNAYNTHLYAELGQIKSKRDNYANDIKKTESYMRYCYLKDCVNILKQSKDWEERAKSYLNDKMVNKQNFRDWFLKKADRKLQDMWYRFGKIASQYYDDAKEKRIS